MSLILPRAFRENPARFDGTRLDARDPDYIRAYLPMLEVLYRYYFRVQACGFEHAPRGEPFIIVGNHNGGINAPDTAMTLHAWYTTFGAEAPVHALIQPQVFTLPYLNVHTMKLGGVAATAKMALKVLESGRPLLLYPGAGDDAYKPFEDRHRIMLCGRDAFVRLALRLKLPVVPIVSLGAHETLIVLDDGRQRARDLGLAELGVERLPLTWSFPQGLSVGMPFNIPLPVKIRLQMGAPIRFAAGGPHPERDPQVVKRCYDAVVQVMQSMLDRMVAERSAVAA
jgi:1-acyl-sn-glycerol-3-phosphate acyltransferase